MNVHAIIDKMSIGVGSIFIKKYFREDIAADSLKKHLDNLDLSFPQINGENDYNVRANTLVGELEALFRIAQWKGSDYPTFVYHHGAAETPFDYGFKKIFPHEKQEVKANLILIRAPFHASRKDFQDGMVTLNNFLAMIATSITLIDKLIVYLKDDKMQPIVVSGTSLGGYVSNFHHIYYDRASSYVPLLAGLDLYDTLFESIYSKGVTKTGLEQKKKLRKLLNFADEFACCDNSNVFPLLGRYDQIVRFEVQKDSYGDCDITTFDKGHVTGSLAGKNLRGHIIASSGLDIF